MGVVGACRWCVLGCVGVWRCVRCVAPPSIGRFAEQTEITQHAARSTQHTRSTQRHTAHLSSLALELGVQLVASAQQRHVLLALEVRQARDARRAVVAAAVVADRRAALDAEALEGGGFCIFFAEGGAWE